MRHAARSAIPIILAAITLGGCSFFSFKPQMRGNHIDPEVLAELKPGVASRADAAALLGSPTQKASFDPNRWIYIGEVTRPRVGRIEGVLSQDVVVLTFNDAGILQTIEKLDQDDSLPVTVDTASTPSPGSDASWLQQLLGGIGRYNPTGGGSTSNSENSNTK